MFKVTGKVKTLKGEIKELEKYVLHCDGADDAKGFEEATKSVFKDIEKNIKFGYYVVLSPIPNFESVDGPSIVKQLTHEEEIELYNDELELHQMKQKKHVDMIMKIMSGMKRAYAILWRQCNQYMKCTFKSMNKFEKNRFEQRPNEAPSNDLKMCIQL